MKFPPRASTTLGYPAMAAAMVLAAACAGMPPTAAQNPSMATATPSSTAASAQSPAPPSKVIDTADFATKAKQEGWHAEIRNGSVIYCRTEMPINSRLPERTCLDKTGVEQMLLAEEHQREAMQRAAAAAGNNGS